MSSAAIPDGVWPTMVTPFHDDLSIDYEALDAMIEWYLEAGVHGLGVALGSEV